MTQVERHPERSETELLVQVIHGGLRLREGYMAIHRYAIEERGGAEVPSSDRVAYARCLTDTFGPEYLEHLERWLAADRAGYARRTNGAHTPPEASNNVRAVNGVSVAKSGSR